MKLLFVVIALYLACCEVSSAPAYNHSVSENIITALKKHHQPLAPTKHKGILLYDLDELMTPEQYEKIFGKRLVLRAAAVKGYSWPQGIIPYTMDDSYDENDTKVVHKVLKDLEKHTCLTFPKKTENDKYHINFIDDEGCYSLLGRQTEDGQPIGLDKRACRLYGTIVHELMHAIGIIHEQQRPDRDEHISVDYDNMDEDYKAQFEAAKKSEINYHKIPYDFSSIMHYDLYSFTNNGKKTMTPLTEKHAEAYIGEYDKPPSYGDIALMNRMYECDSNCEEKPECTDGFVNKECQCVTSHTFYNDECKGDEVSGWCLMYKHQNE